MPFVISQLQMRIQCFIMKTVCKTLLQYTDKRRRTHNSLNVIHTSSNIMLDAAKA